MTTYLPRFLAPSTVRTDAASKVEQAPVALDLSKVYEEHSRYVVRCLRHLGLRDGTVDDAAQDVFLVVHQKLASFDGSSSLRTWLYAIVIRVARRYRERHARRVNSESEETLVGGACPERDIETKQALTIARRALDALDEDKREVFVLVEVEQMSVPEVAQITGVPLNTVYSRLRAARQTFERAATRRRLGDTP